MVVSKVKPMVIFGCLDCSRSLNWSRILTFEKFPDPEPNSKNLELKRSWSPKKVTPTISSR